MNKKMVIGFISAVLILMTGCTSLVETSNSKSPMSQERIASSVNVNDEIFGIGSATIAESGNGVAKMRASKEAREDLKVKLLKETKDVLTAYLIDVDFYSEKVSSKVISDLSEYVTNSMLSDAEERDSWVENERVYAVIAIDRDQIPKHSRQVFITHLDSIIEKLTNIRAQVMAIPIDNQEKEGSSAESAPILATPTEAKEVVAPAPAQAEELEASEEDTIDVQL